MEINALIDEEFREHIDIDWLKNLARDVLGLENASPEVELGLVITSQERVRELNRRYLGKDTPTDVIAFPMSPSEEESGPFILPPDGLLHLGEVIISYPQAVIQAREQGHSVSREMAILVIHGVLHLLGYGDETPELKKEMQAREQEVLGRTNIALN